MSILMVKHSHCHCYVKSPANNKNIIYLANQAKLFND